MQHGERLNRVESRRTEKWLREHADLTAEQQAEGLSQLLCRPVARVTVYRWRRRFEIPSPKEAKKRLPVALAGWDLRNFRRMLDLIVVPGPSGFEARVSLEIEGLDEVAIGDTVFRFVVGPDWTIRSAWFTDDELLFLKHIFQLSDRRRGGHLEADLDAIHEQVTEYANRAFWYGIRKFQNSDRITPMIKRIPKELVPKLNDELEREWLRLSARKLDLQTREFIAAARMAVTA